MSNSKQADHRLVQPRPEHYAQRTREDGSIEDVLVGPYTLEQRNRYFKIMISLYMTRHPDAKHMQAKRMTLVKWRNLVFATIGDEYVPVTDIKQAKNIVKVFPKKEESNESVS